MKKLWKEGSDVFHYETLKYYLFLFFFIPFISNYPQTFLNNFGFTEFVKTYPGYSKFTLIDFNEDGIKDLFLFGNQGKSFVIHEGIKDSTFSEAVKKFFFFPIDDFKWLTKSEAGDDYYIFVSRNKRLAGLVSFTKSNSLSLLNTIEFNSYPSSITITDLNNNGKNEALIYGNNFKGIEIVRSNGYLLNSRSLIAEDVFSDIVIQDFNQDENDGIIAIDVLNNKLRFFENTELLEFIVNREILFEESIFSLEKTDFDLDGFTDLALVKEGGVNILKGDSVYSYSDQSYYSFEFTPDKIIIDDFNSDKKNDIIASNKIDNQLFYVSDFNNINNSTKFSLNSISDIRSFTKNKLKLLIALSKKGELQIISSKAGWGKSFSYKVGGIPNKLYSSKKKDSNNSFLLIENQMDNSISILEIDSKGRFTNFQTATFLNNFEKFGFTSNFSNIIGYNSKKRLLEIISTEDVSIGKNHNYIYTKHPIEYLNVDAEENLIVAEINNRKLFFEKLSNRNNVFESDTLIFIDSLVSKAALNKSTDVYYWKKDNTKLTFNKFNNGLKKQIHSILSKDTTVYNSIILNDESAATKQMVTLIANDNEERIFLVKEDKVIRYTKNFNFSVDKNYTNRIFKFYSSILGNKYLIEYHKEKNRFRFFEIDDKNLSLVPVKTIDAVKCNDYFVSKYFGKTYIVFTNNENNTIRFKTLDFK